MTLPMQNKVIRASAGTGKTYRLSLEYIGLLLTHAAAGIHFSEILVITFTKKATSEIRERIFEHLHHIVNRDEQGRELEANLHAILGIEVTDKRREYLSRVYHDMLLNKTHVNINTIDAFINDIFKTIIAPYLGIVNYDIDDKIPEPVLSELYQALVESDNPDEQNAVHDFFFRSGKRTISDYKDFIKSLLYNRWIFDFISDTDATADDSISADESYKIYIDRIEQLFSRYQDIVRVNYAEKTTAEVLKSDLFRAFIPAEELENPAFASVLANTMTPELLADKGLLLLKMETFWDGVRVFRKKAEKDLAAELKTEWDECRQLLADYLLQSQVRKEQQEILLIVQRIYTRYDEIKFRDKRYTHNDVAYYTFRYLYDADLSLIDEYSVINTFYEYLTSRVRFVLIDEFQDTSMVQYKILLPIINEITSGMGVKDYGGVIVVGDEKQSIYGWRGGERDLLLAMPSVLPDCETLSLDTSYRSNPVIMDFINRVFAQPELSACLSTTAWPYTPVKVHSKASDAHIRMTVRNYTASDTNSLAGNDDALREFVTDYLAPLVHDGDKQLDVTRTAVLARKNSHLEQIAAVLDELGIDYILESSGSILAHRTIVPVMHVFRFLAHNAPYDMLCFLRSDLVLMQTGELKIILQYLREHPQNWQQLFTDLQHIDAVRKLGELLTLANELVLTARPNLLFFTQKLIESYHVTGIFSQENDLVNLNRFLEILSEFSMSRREQDFSLKGFLDFCAENDHQEGFQQIGLQEYNAITLLTIHKAKGLEFDNVFLYHDLGSYGRGSSDRIAYFLDYEPDFSRVRNYIYTLNYRPVLPHTVYGPLTELAEQREKIEALNTIYVAMTRAKYGLYLYFAYGKKGGLDAWLKDVDKKDTTDFKADEALLLAVLQSATALTATKNGPDHSEWEVGSPVAGRDAENSKESDVFNGLNQYIQFEESEFTPVDAEQMQRLEHVDFKSVYVVNRDVDKGNIVHFYLSHIHYGRPEELDYARKQTLGHYGNLLPYSELEAIMQRTQTLISENSGLFDSTVWDRVYTERTLYAQTGRELRLDRMMVDTRNRQVMIIDYKTGEPQSQDQLDEYIQTVRGLPVVKSGGYKVTGQYLALRI